MKRLSALVAVWGLFLAGSGCATWRAYPGPKRPSSEIAVITVSSAQTIVVDDVPVEKSGVSRIELLPGPHEIAWTFVYPNRYEARQALEFHARAAERYRLGQRFFPAPHPGGFLGAVLDAAADAALSPIRIVFPPEPGEAPPDGEYYRWIVHVESGRPEAGLPPDVPHPHAPLTSVPSDDAESTPDGE